MFTTAKGCYTLGWLRRLLSAIEHHRRFRSVLADRPDGDDEDPWFTKVRNLTREAFNLTEIQARKLTRSDHFSWIYAGVAGAFSDRFENENIHMWAEEELGREIPESEARMIITLGDLADLFRKEKSNLP